MFQSKDEAEQRRNNARNLFSPSYVHPVPVKPNGTSQGSKDNEGDGPDNSGRGEDENGSSSEGCRGDRGEDREDTSQEINGDQIDSIISKAVDPYSVRRRIRDLRGQTETQIAVGTTAILLGNRSAGHLYDLSKEQSRAYSDGLSSTSDITDRKIVNEERYKRIGKIREGLAEKAAMRLETALDSLTNDKIEVLSATKASGIAKDMAVVMDKVTRDNSKAESVHFHLFRPELKTIGDYTTVQLSSPIIVTPNTGGGADS